jgi:hypothetical protein
MRRMPAVHRRCAEVEAEKAELATRGTPPIEQALQDPSQTLRLRGVCEYLLNAVHQVPLRY